MIREVLRGGFCAGLLLCSVWALTLTSAHADDALEAAKRRYAEGEVDYNAGRFWQAARAFEQAYDLAKRADLLYNAARSYDRGDYAVRAAETYQAYLAAGEAPDRAKVETRIAELRKTISFVNLKTGETGFILLDGYEYGRTPISKTLEVDSGYHRIEVRNGSRSWAKEQKFTAGVTYDLEAVLVENSAVEGMGTGAGQGLVQAEPGKPKPITRRLGIVAQLGAGVDVVGDNFPPHMGSLQLGGEYRMLENSFFALDLALRLPVELGQGWVASGFLTGVRGAYTPLPRRPLELFFAVDLGFSVFEIRPTAPGSSKFPCSLAPALSVCSVYAFRLQPSLGIAYRFTPAFEMRAQVFGLDVNVGQTLLDPRLTFGLGGVYRFY